MEIEKIKIGLVKANPKNPRIIKDYKYYKLLDSIKDFPEMLEIRPIVIDNENIVLGGNMRLKACKEALIKEVFIIRANNLTEKQKQEFIIKDNIGFGEWDWDILANEYEITELENWGLDLPVNDFTDFDKEEIEDEPEYKINLTFQSAKDLIKYKESTQEILIDNNGKISINNTV